MGSQKQRIDELEEGLSRWVGDIAAHQIGRALRGAAGWGERAGQILAANVKEYLQEESRDLIAKAEAEEFKANVDATRDAVDRLEVRVQELKRARKA